MEPINGLNIINFLIGETPSQPCPGLQAMSAYYGTNFASELSTNGKIISIYMGLCVLEIWGSWGLEVELGRR